MIGKAVAADVQIVNAAKDGRNFTAANVTPATRFLLRNGDPSGHSSVQAARLQIEASAAKQRAKRK